MRDLGSYIKVSGRAGVPPPAEQIRVGQVHPHQGAASLECPAFLQHNPGAVVPKRRCQGNPIKALLRAVGALAVLRCGCSVASLRAGSVTLPDEVLNILQGVQ